MEVHAHSHTPRKKWTHYFWEFLMLFLAVFCGFLAEYQLEHVIEHKKEKQYAGLLIADLKSDTAFLNKEMERLSTLSLHFDTLIGLLRQPVPAPNDVIASRLLHINYVTDAKLIAATYSQMKASGSLRYIRNRHLISDLQQYYEIQLPRCLKHSESSLQFFREYILPFLINNVRSKPGDANESNKDDQPLIIGRSLDADQRLSNIIEKAATILMISHGFYEPANEKATKLIDLLTKEYDLK